MFQFLCCSDAILAMFVSISEFDDFLQLAYHAGSFYVSDSLFQDTAESSKAEWKASKRLPSASIGELQA